MGLDSVRSALAGFALLAALSCGGTARGAMITLTDADATSADAQYEATFANNITVVYDATDVNLEQGTLTISTTWNAGDFAPRTILFKQTVAPTGGFDTGEGARYRIVLSLGNNTGVDWAKFLIATEDKSVPAGIVIAGGGSHLAQAHFHPRTPMLTNTGFTTFSDFNNTQLVELGDGLHGAGNLGFSGFFVHERNFKNAMNVAVQREFTLVLTPIPAPEPAALVQMLLGCVGLACGSRRSWRSFVSGRPNC